MRNTFPFTQVDLNKILLRFAIRDSLSPQEWENESLMRAKIAELSRYYGGLCFGYAAVSSFYGTTGRLNLFQGDLDTLNRQGWRPFMKDHPDRSYVTFVRKFHDDIVFNYGSGVLNRIEGVQLQNFFAVNGLFDCDRGKIKHHAVATGFLSARNLDALLQEDLFQHEGIFLLHGEFLPNINQKYNRHACSVWYSQDKPGYENGWYFVDPDSGVHFSANKQALIQKIIEVLGHFLIIRVASWDTQIALPLSKFTETYNLIRRDPQILNGIGLELLLKYMPNSIDIVFEESSVQPQMCVALTKAVQRRCAHDSDLVLHKLVRYLPPSYFLYLLLLTKFNKNLEGFLYDIMGDLNDGSYQLTMAHLFGSINQLFNCLKNATPSNRAVVFPFLAKCLGLYPVNPRPAALHLFLDAKPQAFSIFLQLLKEADSHYLNSFFEMLLTVDGDNSTLFAKILKKSEDQILTLCEMFTALHPNYFDAFVAVIKEQIKQTPPLLSLLVTYGLNDLILRLIEAANKDPEFAQHFEIARLACLEPEKITALFTEFRKREVEGRVETNAAKPRFFTPNNASRSVVSAQPAVAALHK